MFECLFLFCLGGAPAPSVPDGMGGFVPFTNSRVMPDGSLRPYDPIIDGPYPGPVAVVPSDGYLGGPPPVIEPYPGTWLRPYP